MRPRKSDDFGIPKREIEILARSTDKFKEKFELLKADANFRKEVERLRLKWKIVDTDNPPLVYDDSNETAKLLKKFGLGPEWDYLISIYITQGIFEVRGDPYGIQIRHRRGKNYADIRIYPDTTLRDLKRAYAFIFETFKKNKRVRTGKAPQSDRDTFILELQQKGMKFKEIQKCVEENGYGRIGESYYRKILNKMRKRSKKL